MQSVLPTRGAGALLSLALLVGCTSVDGERSGALPGSPEWYETASQKEIVGYFRNQCVAQGYLVATPEIADCITNEATAAKQSNVAHAAAIAAATAGN